MLMDDRFQNLAPSRARIAQLEAEVYDLHVPTRVTSLPVLRLAQHGPSHFPPSRSRVAPAKLPGRGGLSKMIDEVVHFAESELRVRGIPKRGGYSEARLAVFREALNLLAAQLPASQDFLARVMREFDAAIKALSAEVHAAEAKLSASEVDKQLAEERLDAERHGRRVSAMTRKEREESQQAATLHGRFRGSRAEAVSEVRLSHSPL